jgi:hypothetical protein
MLAPVGHPLFRLRFEVQILKCQSCREIFEIHWTEDNENVVKFTGFVFSCKSIVVQSIYASGFGIGNKELLQPEQYEPQFAKSYIPEFVVNFSDKKKLHKKLKTYLVFS